MKTFALMVVATALELPRPRAPTTLRKAAAVAACGAALALPGAAAAKGGGYGSESSSSSSFSAPSSSSYIAPTRTIIRERRVYVDSGNRVTVVRPGQQSDNTGALVVGVAVGAALVANSGREDAPSPRRKQGGGLALYAKELADVKALMRTLRDEIQETDATKAAIARPVSGQFVGASDEDDKGNQGVVTNLEFRADGSVAGSGQDEVDGAYSLSGRWAGDRCAWIEKYDDGFEVAVTGTVQKSGEIFLLFCSSRGISGNVDLKLRTLA
mmetsp:Transcript_17945/g.53394  ORF Transcript_17945/g.53394 Transcript_17945/m.53394 type:complete len:269 (+) Transcript_17945:204-1010(+)|eukprot:CAMPEP_0119267526 /NCGR_PEP_ID=MMETSP1329-20130426/5620_1 /TAXON_ID=114041 /ORGANISM="Genus nov. species nov., Strain RCC1024" /LENGTH=268 /DNA_ID=CAMNT_0007267453 /DNA_START=206 /DNA_END=1012 /DNA_ORIENTATION=+